jgi:hypothetical protein
MYAAPKISGVKLTQIYLLRLGIISKNGRSSVSGMIDVSFVAKSISDLRTRPTKLAKFP